MPKKIDEFFMSRALQLALKGRGAAHPNPLVGAVLVKGGRILAEGYHACYGGPHAEVNALRSFKNVPKGAVLYVTLEPCAHTGQTPPCTELLLEKGVQRVIVGALDKNPLVSGKGVNRLKRAGVRVQVGVLESQARQLNRDFDHWIRHKTPYVTIKAGQSLDGAIATSGGVSKWITGDNSRRVTMEIRAHADAILVGVNTVIQDNPRLTTRLAGFHGKPLKIILDPKLRTPPDAKIFSKGSRVLLVVSPKAPQARRKLYAGRAELLEIPTSRNGLFDWKRLLRILGARGIVQVLIEGGGSTIGSAVDARVVHEAHFFIAPLILGGRQAVRSVVGEGVVRLQDAPRFREVYMERIDDDFHYTGVY